MTAMRPLLDQVRQHDGKLAAQMRQATDSAPSCLSEGAHRAGGDRPHLYRVAGGSAAELRTHLAVAVAWGYLEAAAAKPASELADRVAAMCWRLVHRR